MRTVGLLEGVNVGLQRPESRARTNGESLLRMAREDECVAFDLGDESLLLHLRDELRQGNAEYHEDEAGHADETADESEPHRSDSTNLKPTPRTA